VWACHSAENTIAFLMNKPRLFASLLAAAVLPLTASISTVQASDHADSPTVAGDQAADLADCYFFLDPNDSTKVVIINTVRGFIVPGEAVNFAIFDSTIRYRFQVENTGDAKPDGFIDVSFEEKSTNDGQKATVVFSGAAFDGIKAKEKFTGVATPATLAPTVSPDYFPATPQQLKNKKGESVPDLEFFAGETDDPFFFDIPGFARFRTKAIAGDPTAANELNRGRDTFAGYNVMTIAFRLPVAMLENTKGKTPGTLGFGLNVLAQRGNERVAKGRKFASSAFKTVDREGLPAVNALLIPLARKNEYNGATTLDDAAGDFADDIVASLKAVNPNISDATIGVLAGLAVANGDILRLQTTVIPSVFPTSGRSPADDVVKTLLSAIAEANLDDSVPANDVPFSTRFPYLGLPHQPRDPGVIDDNTRN
jgi:hypothetical protein